MWPRCRQPTQFIHPAAKIDRLKSHSLLVLARFSPILGHFAIFRPSERYILRSIEPMVLGGLAAVSYDYEERRDVKWLN